MALNCFSTDFVHGQDALEAVETYPLHTPSPTTDDVFAPLPTSEPEIMSTANTQQVALKQHGTDSGRNLAMIFNNPILLSSFIQNFKRKDYTWLAEVAGSLPGVLPWPVWNPLAEPWPMNTLPFSIQDLAVQCQSHAMPRGRLVPRRVQDDRVDCEWEFGDDDVSEQCQSSEQDQGLFVRPDSNNSGKGVEKKPTEFLECVGHRLKLKDIPFLDVVRVLGGMTRMHALSKPGFAIRLSSILRRYIANIPGDETMLTDVHTLHGAGLLICSKCARQHGIKFTGFIWQPRRMLPFCRDCCENPPKDRFSFYDGNGKCNPNDNMQRMQLNEGGKHESVMKCDCYETFSPQEGFHLCHECARWLHLLIDFHILGPTTAGLKHWRCKVIEVKYNQYGLGRNDCTCGKTWDELVASWDGFSQEERDKKMYRLCLMCMAHVPRSKMRTAVESNCL